MADTGYKNPGTASTDNSIGSIYWASSGVGICGDDGSRHYAQATETNAAVITYYLKGTNFGFSIPAGATINGIEFVATKSVSYTATGNRTVDYAVRIIKGGTISTTDKKNVSGWSGIDTDVTYGSSTELWGETWTPNDINSSSFGIALAATIDNNPNEGIYVYVHNFRLKIYYTAASGPANLKTVNGLVKASSKTLRSGLLIASVKTWNGLT